VLVFDRAGADELIDQNQRAQMLKHGDGRIAHLETEYNDLFIDKHGSELGLSSRYGCVAGEVPFRLSRRRSRRKARTKLYAKDADVLTDDFAPADLYRVTPMKTLRGQ
jgi:hypothetical protein